MKIKATVENAAKIIEALEKVNGKRHLIHTYDASEIIEFAKDAEKALKNMNLPKTHRKGAYATGTSCGSVAKAYKYCRIANTIVIERGSAAWFVTALAKTEVYPDINRDRVHLTEEQKKSAVKTMLDTATAI